MVVYVFIYIEFFELVQRRGVSVLPCYLQPPIHRNQVYTTHYRIEVNNGGNMPPVVCCVLRFDNPHPNRLVRGTPNSLIPLNQSTGDGVVVVLDGEKALDACCLH